MHSSVTVYVQNDVTVDAILICLVYNVQFFSVTIYNVSKCIMR